MAYLSRGKATVTLSHREYTVGWICALPCELTAAEAMFDVVHKPLANPPHDKNVYSFGSIANHNVVLTTLPSGVYGTTSATTVAIRMSSTFRSISIPVLVGVGGGVPSKDIRLGDVVVSIPSQNGPAVVQYDYGKTLASGKLQNTGYLNKPTSQLLAAVSRIRASHAAMPSKVPAIIKQALQNDLLVRNGYSYPGADKDILYQSDCGHDTEDLECVVCPPKLVHRQQRPNLNPVFHYGLVASGNQVIKNRTVRDRLYKTVNNLCFEMEAAGIMDYFPALVVRGISDYCDSYKDKIFQPYAALAAAAFTKELLSFIPQQQLADDLSTTLFKTIVEPRCEAVIQGLNFGEARSRLLTIKDPHSNTLKWFSNHPAYLSWLNDADFDQHRGFIWIKGKPGAGKSTLMKYILSQAERRSFTISFFFNARGTELQKTTMGMYRSLLFQMLQHFSELQHSLEILTLPEQLGNIDMLKSLFKAAIEKLDRPLICFIDALDESSEDEIRELLEDLENIIEGIEPGYFRVCCSSRHYPHISIEIGLDFDLDKEDGHANDIKNYVNAKLRIGNSKEAQSIKVDMVHKAAGIFLWVVLVVQILQRAYDHGQVHAMRKKLNEVPAKLDDLFREILLRDKQNLGNLVSSIQWILYSKRPLTVAEFYYAVLLTDDEYVVAPFNPDYITDEDMERFITSSSKGLLEKTQGTRPIIQVIHESVREYLLGATLTELWDGFKPIVESKSHAQMSRWCSRYILDARLSVKSIWPSIPPMSKNFNISFPFFDYAQSHVLDHAEYAEQHGIPQVELLRTFSTCLWVVSGQPILKEQSLRVALVQNNLSMLFKRYMDLGFDLGHNVPDRSMEILFAIKENYVEILRNLFQPAPGPQIDNKKFDKALIQLCRRWEVHNSRLGSNASRVWKSRVWKRSKIDDSSWISLLASDKKNKLMTYLLYSDDWVKQQDPDIIRKLVVIFSIRQLGSTYHYRVLTDDGELDYSEQHLEDLLFAAAATGNILVLDKLLEVKVDPNAAGSGLQMTAMHIAAKNNQAKIVERLVQIANLETKDFAHSTPLRTALQWHQVDAIQILIKAGANVSAALPSWMTETQRSYLASLFSEMMADKPFTPAMIVKVFESQAWRYRNFIGVSSSEVSSSKNYLIWLINWLLHASKKYTGTSCESLFVRADWPLEAIAETLGIASDDLGATDIYSLYT